MNIDVQIAKATDADVERVVAFFQFVEAFFDDRILNDDDEDKRRFLSDEQFIERLRELWGGPFTRQQKVDTAWFRVVFGYAAIVKSFCNADSDVLELRADWAEELQPPPGLDQALDGLQGPRERFRESLCNKRKLLEKLCTHAEHVASIRGVEPWSIISKITMHGKGMSQAIYELYRRR
jgi:hypothetical protein